MKNRKSISFSALLLMLFALIMLTCASCGNASMYWGYYKQTASGKHYKLKPAWGNHNGCAAMHHGQYVKESTVRRYRFN
jgi:hypothetical protein